MPDRPRLPIDELERRIRAREPVLGAVEVPVGIGPTRVRSDMQRGLELSLGTGGTAGAAGVYGAYLGAGVAASAGLTGAAVLGVMAAAAIPVALGVGALAMSLWLPYSRRTKRRVLVMAPDGCVIGFHGGVRALEWEEIAGFAIGQLPDGEPQIGDGTALDVIARDRRSSLGHVQAEWFSQPLEVIVAVAEAYRKRAIGDL